MAILGGMVGMGLIASSRVEAQDIGDPVAGRALAQRWCSACHMVTSAQQNALANGVPTFSGIARLPSTTAISLRVFLQTPHVRMPDLQLTHDEISNVSAYILSLKGR